MKSKFDDSGNKFTSHFDVVEEQLRTSTIGEYIVWEPDPLLGLVPRLGTMEELYKPIQTLSFGQYI